MRSCSYHISHNAQKLTLLQKVTHRMPFSNSVFRATHCFSGAGGFGGESDRCTEIPVNNSNPILRRTGPNGTPSVEVGGCVIEEDISGICVGRGEGVVSLSGRKKRYEDDHDVEWEEGRDGDGGEYVLQRE